MTAPHYTPGRTAPARWLLLLGLLGPGCPRPESPPAPAPAPRAAAAEVPAEEVRPAAPLTAEKLDAFLRYQAARLELDAGLLEELGGGKRGRRAPEGRAALAVLERKAQAEEEARAATGLSREEVRVYSEAVTTILQPRLLARALGLAETVALLEAQRDRLHGQRREELERQLAPLLSQKAELEALAAERARYGDAVVEVVLAREADLLRNHDAMIERLSAGR